MQIEVVDTGVGIPAKDLPHIFERFYRSDSGKPLNASGTGLGLAIASKMMEAHGKTLKVESEEGNGTRFYFELDST